MEYAHFKSKTIFCFSKFSELTSRLPFNARHLSLSWWVALEFRLLELTISLITKLRYS